MFRMDTDFLAQIDAEITSFLSELDELVGRMKKLRAELSENCNFKLFPQSEGICSNLTSNAQKIEQMRNRMFEIQTIIKLIPTKYADLVKEKKNKLLQINLQMNAASQIAQDVKDDKIAENITLTSVYVEADEEISVLREGDIVPECENLKMVSLILQNVYGINEVQEADED